MPSTKVKPKGCHDTQRCLANLLRRTRALQERGEIGPVVWAARPWWLGYHEKHAGRVDLLLGSAIISYTQLFVHACRMVDSGGQPNTTTVLCRVW